MSKISIPAEWERSTEAYALITGRANYVDDLSPPTGRPCALHLAVVRSPYAHATIKRINLDAARALPGVAAAFAGAELVSGMPTFDSFPVAGLKNPERRPLAVGRARYVGDPVAVVLAENRYLAEDARDQGEVDYEPLPAVGDPEAAAPPGAPLLYDEPCSNVAFHSPTSGGDIPAAFANADHVVRLRLVNHRLRPTSIASRACMFHFDPASNQLPAWISSPG